MVSYTPNPRDMKVIDLAVAKARQQGYKIMSCEFVNRFKFACDPMGAVMMFSPRHHFSADFIRGFAKGYDGDHPICSSVDWINGFYLGRIYRKK